MMEQQSDRALVGAARAGDKRAFDVLIKRHMQRALYVAQRMMGDADLAQDLAQEACLQAYLSLEQLQQPDHFANWLYGIVLNVCRNALRSHRVNMLSWETLAGGVHFNALPFTSVEPGPQEIAEANELIACVRAAVNELSPKNRQATLLFYFEGCSIREIAAQLGVSVTAVKGRLHKSRLQLHDLLMGSYLPPSRQHAVVPSSLRKGISMIPVTIADVVQQENGNCVVVLLDEAGARILPIWIGGFEAHAVAFFLTQRAVPRPLTYQFIANILNATNIQLESVCVSALQGHTYYATAKFRSGDATFDVDARPSDAVALALCTEAPIFVNEEVMERTGAPIPDAFRAQPMRKGLDKFVQYFEEQQKAAQLSAEASDEEKADDVEAARQKLLAYLFWEPSTG